MNSKLSYKQLTKINLTLQNLLNVGTLEDLLVALLAVLGRELTRLQISR